jgi:hypothetical protein
MDCAKPHAVVLAEAGCSAPVIAAISGHLTLGEVQRYIDESDRVKTAKRAIKALPKSKGFYPKSGTELSNRASAALSNLKINTPAQQLITAVSVHRGLAR